MRKEYNSVCLSDHRVSSGPNHIPCGLTTLSKAWSEWPADSPYHTHLVVFISTICSKLRACSFESAHPLFSLCANYLLHRFLSLRTMLFCEGTEKQFVNTNWPAVVLKNDLKSMFAEKYSRKWNIYIFFSVVLFYFALSYIFFFASPAYSHSPSDSFLVSQGLSDLSEREKERNVFRYPPGKTSVCIYVSAIIQL